MNEFVLPPKRSKIEEGGNGEDEDWRKSVISFPHLLRTMFEKQIGTDVTFQFGPENNSKEIKCHEFILLAHSPAFKAMLTQHWNGYCNWEHLRVITALVDDNPEHFHFFVKMMYWNWNIHTYDMYIIPEDATPEIAVGVLSLAYKYSAGYIIRLAEHFIHSYLKLGLATNMVKLYKLLKRLPICDVGQDARKNFRTVENCLLGNGENVFSSDAILQLNETDLVCIVKQSELRCPEEIVFVGCIKWAKNQCKLKQISSNGRYLRWVLGDVLKLIRFPIMEKRTLKDVVLPQKILTEEEFAELKKYKNSKMSSSPNIKMPLRFSTTSRITNEDFLIRRLDVDEMSEHLLDFSTPHGFVMTISKEVKLSSLGFYGADYTVSNPDALHVELEIGGENIVHGSKEILYGSTGKTIIIRGFQPEIKILANTPVNIKFTITGGLTFVTQEKVEEVTNEYVYWNGDTMICTFRTSSNVANGLKQIPILFFSSADKKSTS